MVVINKAHQEEHLLVISTVKPLLNCIITSSKKSSHFVAETLISCQIFSALTAGLQSSQFTHHHRTGNHCMLITLPCSQLPTNNTYTHNVNTGKLVQ